jgi:hypothetical protein
VKHRPLLYLETSIFGFYFDEMPYNLLHREAVRELFRQVELGILTVVTSPATIRELADSPGPFRGELMRLLSGVEVMEQDEAEVKRLASCYVTDGIIPADYAADAEHVASATVAGVGVVVTLNLKHLANEWAERRINAVNLRQGYAEVRIRLPEEVLKHED